MAIGFKLIQQSAQDEYKNLRIASQAYTIGDLVMVDLTADAIDVVPATSSATTTKVFAVAMETVTSAATTALFCLIKPDQRWVADVTNAPVTNDNFERMILTDARTVNNTHTDDTSVNAVFQQMGVVDATAKRIVGRFLISNVSA